MRAFIPKEYTADNYTHSRMVSTRWTHSNTTIYNIGYHIIWCPKYRREVLVGDVEKRLKELLLKKANKISVSIIEMEIMLNHIHMFVKAPPTASPHWIVQQLKGYTSHELRKEFESLRTRLPTLWTRTTMSSPVDTSPRKL